MARGKVLALVLAGGAGGRLDGLTEERAKPALPFAGVYRLIDFALSNCVHSGLSDVWVLQQYEPHPLNEHLSNGRPWDLDRTYGGLRVLHPHQARRDEAREGWYQGNADAIYRSATEIREFDPDLVLVLSADHVYKLDYRDVIAAHLDHDADVTMVTTRVPLAEAGRFGTVVADDRGRVTGFAYKPERPESDLATTEVFVYNARVLLNTLDALAAEAGGQGDSEGEESPLKDFGHALVPRLVEGGRAYAYRFDGYWRDVGTVESYWQAHLDLLVDRPELALDDPDWPILTLGAQRLPARIAASARIEQSLISPGCTVRGRVVCSVLGPGVVVEEGATVRDSVVLHDTVIGPRAMVARAIVDMRATVEEGARVGARGAEGGIAIVGLRARIPAKDRVPAGGKVMPGATKAGSPRAGRKRTTARRQRTTS